MIDNQEPVTATEDEELTILIEWPHARGGVQEASRGNGIKKMQEQSQKALNLAMGTIRAMAYRVSQTIDKLENKVRPDEAEVKFGITLDAEAGAMLAKASTGAQITVKLKWTTDQLEKATVLVSE